MSSTPQLCSQWQLCTIILNLPCTYSTTTIIPGPIPYQLDLTVKTLDFTVFCTVTWLSRRPMSSISSNNSVTAIFRMSWAGPYSLHYFALQHVFVWQIVEQPTSVPVVTVAGRTSDSLPCLPMCYTLQIKYYCVQPLTTAGSQHFSTLATIFRSHKAVVHVALLIPQEKPVKWQAIYMC